MARMSKRLRAASGLDWLPASGPVRDIVEALRTASTVGAWPPERIRSVRLARDLLDQVEADAWEAARSQGLSWSQIASEVGVTKSGAQQRATSLLARRRR